MTRDHILSLSFLCVLCVLCGQLQAAEPAARPAATQPAVDILDRVSCSSLVQCKHPLEPCLKTVAKLGYKYIDLSCLSWEPRHASAQALVKDFEAEATRVENALKENGLKVSNLTFDSVEGRPWDQYQAEFVAVVKLAVRLNARLINLMAPSAKAKWDEQVPKLRQLLATAKQAGVILTVETHTGQMTELPANAEKLCKEVPGLGLTLDPSHYYAGPNQGKPFKNLYPYVQGTGFRAGGMSWATVQMPWGEGPIDFAQIVRDLEAGGYKGYYVVEYLAGHNKLDAPTEAKKFLDWARCLAGRQQAVAPSMNIRKITDYRDKDLMCNLDSGHISYAVQINGADSILLEFDLDGQLDEVFVSGPCRRVQLRRVNGAFPGAMQVDLVAKAYSYKLDDLLLTTMDDNLDGFPDRYLDWKAHQMYRLENDKWVEVKRVPDSWLGGLYGRFIDVAQRAQAASRPG